MKSRTLLQKRVWFGMNVLAAAGLGKAKALSGGHRDNFILDRGHPIAERLVAQHPAKAGFIRSDNGGLLFRYASSQLRQSLPASLSAKAMPASRKGLEFRWGRLDRSDIAVLFGTVVGLAVDARAMQATAT